MIEITLKQYQKSSSTELKRTVFTLDLNIYRVQAFLTSLARMLQIIFAYIQTSLCSVLTLDQHQVCSSPITSWFMRDYIGA